MKIACETTGLTEKAIENINHILSLFDTTGTGGKAQKSIFIDFLESSFFASTILSFTENVLLKVKIGIVSEDANIMQEIFTEALELEMQKNKKASVALEQVEKSEKHLFSGWFDLKVQVEGLEETLSSCYDKFLSIMDSYADRVSSSFVEKMREDYSDEKRRLLKKSFETSSGFGDVIGEIDSTIDNKFTEDKQEASNNVQHHQTEE